jgi:Flp pilus assembly protein TadG
MNTVKTLLAGAALAVAVILASPNARAAASEPKDLGVTNVLALVATQTSDLGTYVDIRNWENVSMAFTFYGAALGDGLTTSSNVTVTFARTTGNPTSSSALWETTPKFTWAVPANGTNVVVAVTNLPRDSISGITGFKVVSIQNAATNRIDGVQLLVTAKGFVP